MSDSFTKESRREWNRAGFNNPPSVEELKLGCLQRIATATELACKDREQLERDYAYMRRDRDSWRSRSERSERSNSALRGQITKLKRAAAKATGTTP